MSKFIRDEAGFVTKKDLVWRGAWIFISHSLKDFEKVRRVRNTFEELGARPLLFFLKCITDDDELIPLLKREIEARRWFMLCDSKNAEKSRLVRQEKRFIKRKKGEKQYEKINLDAEDFEEELEKIKVLVKRATMFISYSHRDEEIAAQIVNSLLDHDYGVFFDRYSLGGGESWKDTIDNAMEEVANNGHLLILLSPDSIKELKVALDNYEISNIIPIIVRNPEYVYTELSILFEEYNLMSRVQWADFTKGTLENNIAQLISVLERPHRSFLEKRL